jgi:hypothetical protein
VNRVVLDFLNFIFPQEVHIESIHGIREEKRKNFEENTSKQPQKREEVKIFYPYAISKMFKPTVRTGAPIFKNLHGGRIQAASTHSPGISTFTNAIRNCYK